MKRVIVGAVGALAVLFTGVVASSSSEPAAPILASAAGWTAQWGGVGDDLFQGVAVTSAGDFYVGGISDPAPPPPPMMDQPALDVLGGVDGVIAKYDKNGVQKWTRKFGSTGTEEKTVVGSTPSGDVYGAGSTSGTFSGQPTNPGGTDIFVVKYDKNGNQKWERQLGTSSSETVNAIAVTAAGDVYVIGTTDGNLDGQTNNGSLDAFVVKYDKNGNKKWVRLIGTSGPQWGFGVAATSTDVVIVGTGAAPTAPTPLSTEGSAFVVELDKSGTVKWQTEIGTTAENDSANGVAIAKSGEIYVSGSTGGEFADEILNTGGNELYLAKLTKNGAPVWAHQMTRSSMNATAPTVAKNGDVYVGGQTGLALPGQHEFGDWDDFVVKYNSAGALQWIRQFGTTSEDFIGGIVAVPSGGVAVAGSTQGILWGHTNFGARDGYLALFPAN